MTNSYTGSQRHAADDLTPEARINLSEQSTAAERTVELPLPKNATPGEWWVPRTKSPVVVVCWRRMHSQPAYHFECQEGTGEYRDECKRGYDGSSRSCPQLTFAAERLE